MQKTNDREICTDTQPTRSSSKARGMFEGQRAMSIKRTGMYVRVCIQLFVDRLVVLGGKNHSLRVNTCMG